mgnify:CR=1 FL=1
MDNLWDTHPPFQIDGNFGGTAGITEMLLQSHMGFIQLLPALPDAWKDGSISGICAKGNFEVDMIWENHQLKEAVVRSNAGGNCVIKYADQTISFKTVKGRSYQIGYDAAKGSLKIKTQNIGKLERKDGTGVFKIIRDICEDWDVYYWWRLCHDSVD